MWSLGGSRRLCVSKTPLILHPSIYGMLAWCIKAFSFEGDSCPSRGTRAILGSMYNDISEFMRLRVFKRAIRTFSTLRHIVVVAVRALVVVNGGQGASSTVALAHRKEQAYKWLHEFPPPQRVGPGRSMLVYLVMLYRVKLLLLLPLYSFSLDKRDK